MRPQSVATNMVWRNSGVGSVFGVGFGRFVAWHLAWLKLERINVYADRKKPAETAEDRTLCSKIADAPKTLRQEPSRVPKRGRHGAWAGLELARVDVHADPQAHRAQRDAWRALRRSRGCRSQPAQAELGTPVGAGVDMCGLVPPKGARPHAVALEFSRGRACHRVGNWTRNGMRHLLRVACAPRIHSLEPSFRAPSRRRMGLGQTGASGGLTGRRPGRPDGPRGPPGRAEPQGERE